MLNLAHLMEQRSIITKLGQSFLLLVLDFLLAVKRVYFHCVAPLVFCLCPESTVLRLKGKLRICLQGVGLLQVFIGSRMGTLNTAFPRNLAEELLFVNFFITVLLLPYVVVVIVTAKILLLDREDKRGVSAHFRLSRALSPSFPFWLVGGF